MKFKFLTVLIIMLTFFGIKNFSKEINTNNNDENYVIIKKIKNIEIREYKSLIYASYTPNNSERNNSFRKVANYIFGSNNKNEKIAMTSPVVIKLHNKNEMAFIMPEKYTLQNLPKPNSKEIDIYREPSNIKASISYSGWSNEKKEQKKINELKKILKKNNIKHHNDFEVLVYNSPWTLINRRNEIVVSIDYKINNTKNINNMDTIYFGSGCFWCTEAIFEDVIGVNNVRSGYSGGKIKNPSYREVSNGLTKHAEVCEITYDKNKIELEDLLRIFFLSHDPTTLNKQGNDIGEHYRSIILYKSDEESDIISNFTQKMNKEFFDNKIVTEIKIFDNFYEAEDYHQNYYKQNISQSYCRLVITPKLTKAKKELKKYYKKQL